MKAAQMGRLASYVLVGVTMMFTASCSQAGDNGRQEAIRGPAVNVQELPGKVVYILSSTTWKPNGTNESLNVVNANGTEYRKLLDNVRLIVAKWLSGGQQILIWRYEEG